MVPAPTSSGADWVQKSCRSRNQVQSVHASSTVTLHMFGNRLRVGNFKMRSCIILHA